MTNKLFTSKKRAFLILGITAFVFSRASFFFFNDPEGPNLLVVTVVAAILYFVSLTVYVFRPLTNDLKRFWLALIIQIVLVIGFCFAGIYL
jgi:hypothetical protein